MGLLGRILGRRRDAADNAWQAPIVQEICMEMIRLAPNEWTSAYLILEVTDRGFGSGLSHSAITPELSEDGAIHAPNFVLPDMAVMAATRKLELGWLERNKTFKRAIISAVEDADGWQVQSDYQHE